MSGLSAPELWPFVLSAGLTVALGITEALALFVGASTTAWLDHVTPDFDLQDNIFGAALGWLHLGRVPALVILVLFLTTFAVVGFLLQFVAHAATGFYVATPLAVGAAGLGAMFGVRIFGTALARVIPSDETNAVSDATLVGRVGAVVIGTASHNKPAQVRVRDQYGTSHYVMVEPEDVEDEFKTGESVLLVHHISGRHFHGIHNPKPELL